MTSSDDSLQALVHAQVENLRPKLLDLSRRNPLVSTKLGTRSNSHIRVVDELPDVLFFRLNNAQEMNIISLPPIEEDPRDEQTPAFREALINARLTDDAFVAAMEAIDRDADNYLELTRSIERALKDKLRAQFGMAHRIQKSEINLTQHAKNNGILPAYELPKPEEQNKDGRHTDDQIQTLLLPNDLERKLNAIMSKSQAWIQETGISVLQVAFGFLEWSDDFQTDASYAPLILLPVKIRKSRTSQGPKYFIEGTGDEPELNAVLAEKFRIEFAIELPAFDGSSIETYLGTVANVLPKKRNWRVRRQVAIGVFPSARMAMYHDLDPKHPSFPRSDIVQALLAGSDSAGASPFADEYNVDEPEIEAKVPYIVMDADSSQFSALVDIGEGKNVAVEGPPGTGKSQTIVNAIAAALGQGKKVLFVAEKLAALNVVKARLEAIGLGEFLLPLQAEKSAREQVMESIRSRIEMRDSRSARDYTEKLEEFRRIRSELADYIDVITQEFGDSGLTVHAILGKSIATNDRLLTIQNDVLECCRLPEDLQTGAGFASLLQLGSHMEKAHAEFLTAKAAWKGTVLLHPERFTVEEACALASKAASYAVELSSARSGLDGWGINSAESVAALEVLKNTLRSGAAHIAMHPKDLVIALLDADKANAFSVFIDQCESLKRTFAQIAENITEAPVEGTLQKVRKVASICADANLTTINNVDLAGQLQTNKKFAASARSIAKALGSLIAICDDAENWKFNDLSKAYTLYRKAGRDAVALRHEKLRDDNAAQQLRTMCEEGNLLQQTRKSLANRVSVSDDIPAETLVAITSTLRAAGYFSFFSGRYRIAKRFFKSISKSASFSNSEAVICLDELIAFRRNSREFTRRAQASGLFGLYYRGLDTNYEPFHRLAIYLEELNRHFGGPDRAQLRAFARNATAEQLDLLPALPTTEVPLTFKSLKERLARADDNVQRIATAIGNLDGLAGVFRNVEIDPSSIEVLSKRLEAALSDQLTLDRHIIAAELLGEQFKGHKTECDRFRDLASWAQSAGSEKALIRAALTLGDIGAAESTIENVLSADAGLHATLARLEETAKIKASSFLRGKTLSEAAAMLKEASGDSDGLFAHAIFNTALEDAAAAGLVPLVEDRLRLGTLMGFGGQVEALAIRQLAKAVYTKLGKKLTKYRGTKLDDLRAELAKKDKEIINLSRRQLRAMIKAGGNPPRGNGLGRKSTWTGMALIENEITKKQRYISTRDLTQRAGNALLELKPCWMVSPLAVAQYVPKGSLKFDLCIIDEASQMPPESAIGALLRCDQAVVVGDTNQLPPSSFFKTLIDDQEVDEDEAVLNESILELANGAFRPARRLRWHYRSRHSGLIKFSNRLVYDDSLIVFPSATESMSRMGVEFRPVKGRYKAGTNPAEAKAIIESVVEFMKTDPERSLGVVTLNQKQRELIAEEFEYAISNDRLVQKYIDTWKEKNDGLEEFFIKNLENVQGDERDVIFIGTVYGPEEPGARVMQRFGPINGLAGKRRLNVLFTRAKQKIVTFSSMSGADIQAEEHTNAGAHMLRRWLEFAASGVLDGGEETSNEPDSDFEIYVIDQIRAMGCNPVPQVGVAGYFVDIGVRHSEWPYGFILGVECDGATYHSAKSARDRDRLRQEILENLGWQLHRIWSTDWFNNPRREAEKLRKVIAERLALLKSREREYVKVVPEPHTPRAPTLDSAVAVTAPEAENAKAVANPLTRSNRADTASHRVEVGDTVRVRYLSDDRRTIKVTISEFCSDPSQGIIHYQTPVASALLGTEEGDEVEVLVGSYIRAAMVESISKGGSRADNS